MNLPLKIAFYNFCHWMRIHHWQFLPLKFSIDFPIQKLNESQPHSKTHTLQNTHIANLPLKIPIEWIYHQKSTIENFPLKTHTLNESQPKISTKNAIEKHTHSKIFPIENLHWMILHWKTHTHSKIFTIDFPIDKSLNEYPIHQFISNPHHSSP